MWFPLFCCVPLLAKPLRVLDDCLSCSHYICIPGIREEEWLKKGLSYPLKRLFGSVLSTLLLISDWPEFSYVATGRC